MEIRIKNVGKRYGDLWALRNFTLSTTTGVLGLLGPNGAGKSTLMRILATITQPTEGTVMWNGTDIAESPKSVRSDLGYLPQNFGTYPDLTAEDFLKYFAALKGVRSGQAETRIDELLDLVNLTDTRDQKLSDFSGGMEQRVGIALALLNDPNLLIVDEPTVGLDPAERVRFRNILSSLADDIVVILSTHIVSDVEATASEIAIMNGGALLTHTTPEKAISAVKGNVWEWIVSREDLPDIKRNYLVSGTTRRSDGVHTRVISDQAPGPNANRVEPTLEDAYLDMTSGEAR
ncbi:ABC transporter ATP-binding protein [Halorussus pelagicus]|uniref:ABC transporter ATP-binding protein n=1 Tax=Halorussus pelagicus TaxID=2505977 RepID=UPI000FFC1A03